MRTTRLKRQISGMSQQCKAPGCLQATEGECGISRHLPLSKNIMAMATFWQLLLKMEGSPLSEEKAQDKTRQDSQAFEGRKHPKIQGAQDSASYYSCNLAEKKTLGCH